jgi:hypothetical protein
LIDCSLGNVLGGVTRTINTRLRSDDIASNTAVVHVSASNDAGMNNNQSQGNIDIEPGVDLAIELAVPSSGTTAQASEGSFTLRNLSSTPARSPTLDLTATPGLTLPSVTLDGATCTANGNRAHCTLSTLAPGAAFTGTLSLTAASSGTFQLTAEIAGADLDANLGNNSATVLIQVSSTAGSVVSASPTSSGGGGGALGVELPLLGLLWWLYRRRVQATTCDSH